MSAELEVARAVSDDLAVTSTSQVEEKKEQEKTSAKLEAVTTAPNTLQIEMSAFEAEGQQERGVFYQWRCRLPKTVKQIRGSSQGGCIKLLVTFMTSWAGPKRVLHIPTS